MHTSRGSSNTTTSSCVWTTSNHKFVAHGRVPKPRTPRAFTNPVKSTSATPQDPPAGHSPSRVLACSPMGLCCVAMYRTHASCGHAHTSGGAAASAGGGTGAGTRYTARCTAPGRRSASSQAAAWPRRATPRARARVTTTAAAQTAAPLQYTVHRPAHGNTRKIAHQPSVHIKRSGRMRSSVLPRMIRDYTRLSYRLRWVGSVRLLPP